MEDVLIGEGVVSINDEILQGLHDGSYINIEANGVTTVTLRMRIASIDDRFLNGLLQKQLARENDWLKGQYIRSILGASGNLTSVSTLLEEGLFTNIPSSSSSDVVEYKLQFGNHTTTYE